MSIGILGGGQLGRMLALAGYPLGLHFRFLDPGREAPAGHLADLVVGAFDDLQALERFAFDLDLVTYEFENVPVSSARFLSHRLPVFPSPEALEIAQDRLQEKAFFSRLGIPVAPYAPVSCRPSLDEAIQQIGLPAVLKTCRLGYDGKGQLLLRTAADCDKAWKNLAGESLVLEQFVPFEREISLLAARSRTGQIVSYPLVENHHREGILRLSRAPAPGLTAALQSQAEDHGRRILEDLDYVGVLAIEFFQVNDRLLANEMAPRVHNSGHWTIEGAATSQFENHLRALLGLPLGSTAVTGCAAMVNLIGTTPPREAVLAVAGAHLHLYGKDPRPGRKLGHVTLCSQDNRELEARLAQILELAGEKAPGRG